MKWFAINLLLFLIMLGKFARSFVRPTATRSHRSFVRFSTTSSLESVTDDLKRMLVQLISTTERGAKDTNRAQIFQVIDDLSKSSVSFTTADMLGEWELLYSDDDVTRASPFFWAFRKALSGIEDPLRLVGPKLLSESIFKITDSIPLKSIGTAAQIFEEDDTKERGTLRSRIVVKVNPGNFQSVMATTSKWRRTDEPDLIEIEVQKTEVLESSLANRLSGLTRLVPGAIKDAVGSIADNGFPSGAALELIKPGSSTVYMRIAYQDSKLRIIRNEADGKTFVFGRIV